jgi:hypothetical protein
MEHHFYESHKAVTAYEETEIKNEYQKVTIFYYREIIELGSVEFKGIFFTKEKAKISE